MARRRGADAGSERRPAKRWSWSLRKRQDKMRAYFDELAGKFGRQYVPGRSWKGLAETLLKLMPPMVIADLGAGEGTFSQLLARRAREGHRHRQLGEDGGIRRASWRANTGCATWSTAKATWRRCPIEDGAVDLALFSQSLHHAQHPQRAMAEAYRILKPGGRIIVLDLVKHHFEEARELYADLWLGFTEVEVQRHLRGAGFKNVRTSVVHREAKAPHFETMLATGDKAREN